MGVMQHRKRAADRMPEGGGLTAVSLTDTATDDDIMEHDSGEGPSGDLGDVSLDYDETYRELADSNDPYTKKEAREDASRFDVKPYDRSDAVRDVAQEWRPNTISFDQTADAFLLAGADPLRKRLVIRNVTQGIAIDGAANAHIGNDASVPANPGAGVFVLRSEVLLATGFKPADELVLTHTGEVWVRAAGTASKPIVLSYLVERYYR